MMGIYQVKNIATMKEYQVRVLGRWVTITNRGDAVRWVRIRNKRAAAIRRKRREK